MWQWLKPLTERQYAEKDLKTHNAYQEDLLRQRDFINKELQNNTMMIEHLAKKLEFLK